MNSETIIQALLLGIVEGLTEFIPVSSTAHILLLGHFLNFDNPGKTFEVLIQLGAICAIMGLYFGRLWIVAKNLPSDPSARRFVIGVVLAFLPAAIVGVLAHGFIKQVLFVSPMLICITLITGGILLLLVDRMELRPKYTNAMDYPVGLCFKIGLFQCLALIPGVSRSGATIAGSLLMGTDKRSAAEFSFFLAMPTMTGAFAYDLYKNFHLLNIDDAGIIIVGFIAAFAAAILVVRKVLDFISQHGFSPFAWWRIFFGGAGLIALLLLG
ncbi:MAG: undecaprenyl-diphosphate phosphatase [Fimbriimonadaceae bacterium]|nr:undecaprenyl-diphosphate phosphatase [Alphaproteobacteria bacterium]